MKIYIAAPWKFRAEMPFIAGKFEQIGCEITRKWWEAEDTPEHERSIETLREQAEQDVLGVTDANLVVVINSAKSEGKALEQGVAVAQRKPIIIVGKRGEFSQNVFHYLKLYKWVESLDQALEIVTTIKWLLGDK